MTSEFCSRALSSNLDWSKSDGILLILALLTHSSSHYILPSSFFISFNFHFLSISHLIFPYSTLSNSLIAFREVIQNWYDECIIRARAHMEPLLPAVETKDSKKSLISWTISTPKRVVGEMTWAKKSGKIDFVNEGSSLPDAFNLTGFSSKKDDADNIFK